MATDIETSEAGSAEAAAAPPPASPAPGGAPTAAAWLRIGLPLLLVLVAGALRFQDLAVPERLYFDEIYYAEDSADYLELGVEGGRAVHPMIGKWLIAAGIAVAGDHGYGWRVSAAVAGTLTVLALYLVGVRLFRRRGIAALAALLLTLDGIAFTSSRISMLDSFLALFVVIGFAFLLVDRDRLWSAAPASPGEAGAAVAASTPLLGWPRLAAGIVFGLALGTKWSALLAIGAAGLFVLGSEYAWRRRWGRLRAGWHRPLLSAGLTLVVVPLAVYLLSYVSWFANYENTQPAEQRCGESAEECPASVGSIFGDWLREQAANYEFHRDLEAEHRYRAAAWTWPILSRPVAYYYESCKPDRAADAGPCVVDEGNVAEILGIGNPGVWWVALVFAYPVLAVGAIRRDWRAWAIAVFLLAQFLPWLISPRPVFLFYSVPLVPFLALSSAYAAGRVDRRVGFRWVPGAVAGVAVAGFLFWWPIFVGREISEGAWRLRILFDSWI